MQTTLTILAFAITQSVQATGLPQDNQVTYVSFEQHRCVFWTGDVMFNAAEFTDDLRSDFDPKRTIIISYSQDVPSRCVKRARRAVAAAGFANIRLQVEYAKGS